MIIDGLILPEWLETALGIANEMIIPLLSTIMSTLILIVVAVVRHKLDSKISEYQQLIEVLKNIDSKDATEEVKTLRNKIDDMNKGFATMVSAMELIFTNSNLPVETRDKLGVIFAHAKTNDYETLLTEAKEEAERLKEQIVELKRQLENPNENTETEETPVVNTERA